MIQKKVCMVGVYGTGKTSLVQQFVNSIFSVKYHSTVGVKVDRKVMDVDGTPVTLVLWDVAGRDPTQEIPASYLRGSHAILFVADGTRRETFDQLSSLRDLARAAAGNVPSMVALNKADLTDQWILEARDEAALESQGWHRLRTSAKTGAGVEDAFAWLARAALGEAGTRP
jgi:small GTP-binding protein